MIVYIIQKYISNKVSKRWEVVIDNERNRRIGTPIQQLIHVPRMQQDLLDGRNADTAP